MSDSQQPRQYRFCAACGAEHAIGVRFCGHCGAALCTKCGATARRNATFCHRCGQPIAPHAVPPPLPQGEGVPPRGPLPESQLPFPPNAAPWLIEFVDRQEILGAFQRLRTGALNSKRVILLQGAKGVGKSFLLRRLREQCRQDRISHALLDLADLRGVEDIKIMRDVRDGIDAGEFGSFTDLLNYYTIEGYTMKLQVEVINRDNRPGGGVTIGDQAQVGGVIAGRDAIVIKDNNLTAPRRDIEIDKRQMQDALTLHFVKAVKAVCQQRQIVCLFDNVDSLGESTSYWFWRDLVGPLVEQGNFLAVLTMATGATSQAIDRWTQSAIESAALSNLSEPHVIEYLERRGVPEGERRAVADRKSVV